MSSNLSAIYKLTSLLTYIPCRFIHGEKERGTYIRNKKISFRSLPQRHFDLFTVRVHGTLSFRSVNAMIFTRNTIANVWCH